MHFRYFDPLEQAVVEGELAGRAEVAELIGVVSGLRSDCSPAVEFTGFSGIDGTSLVLGVDQDRAVVLWTTADGTTRHSIGGRAPDRATFDFFGERTQMPGHYAVPLAAALDVAGSLADGGRDAPSLPLALD